MQSNMDILCHHGQNGEVQTARAAAGQKFSMFVCLLRYSVANFVKTVSPLNRAGSFQVFQIRFVFVRFSISSTRFVFFRFLHITAMKAHAVGKISKESEAAEASTPSTSSMQNQQLLLMRTSGRDAVFDLRI